MSQALLRRRGASFPLAVCYRIAWLAALCMVWGSVSEVAAQDCVTPNENGQPRNLAICGPPDANEGNSGTRILTYTVAMSRQRGAGGVTGFLCFSGTANVNTMENGWSPDADYRLLLSDGTPSKSSCAGVFIKRLNKSITVDIEVRGDADGEPNDTVIATFTFLGSYPDITLVTSTHTHTILNDDGTALPEISIAEGSSPVTEGDSAKFTVTASPAPTAPLTVNLIVSESDDFARSGETGSSKTVSVPTSGSATYSVSTDDDNTDEEDGSVTVNLNSGTGYTVGNTNSATVDVNDNDLPQANFVAAMSSASEDDAGSTHDIPLNLTSKPTGNVTVNYTLDGTATLGTDYTISGVTGNSGSIGVRGSKRGGWGRTAKSGTITIGASPTGYIQVEIMDDSVVESSETVILMLASGTGYDVGTTTTTHTLTITDNEARTPEANFAESTSSEAESVSPRNITVNLIPVPTGNVTVNYTLSGTAVRGTDYTISGVSSNSGTITVGTSGTADIPVMITDDSVVEESETVILTLNSGTGYDVGSDSTYTLTITNNDTPEANFGMSASSEPESVSPRDIAVNLSPVPIVNVTVNYTLSGTALRGTDYSISGVSSNSGTITVGTSGTANIPVEIMDDSAVEESETVILTLNSGTGYDVGDDSTHTLTITNNDTPEANFAMSTSSAGEDAGTHTHSIAVNLSPVPIGDVTVNYTLSGDATLNTDYTIIGPGSNSGSITVGTSGTADIPVVIIDDSVVESSETVILTLGSGTGYDVGATTTTHTLTITDNEVRGPPEANFADSTSSAGEDAGTHTHSIAVNLSPVPIGDVTVNYTLSGTPRSTRIIL